MLYRFPITDTELKIFKYILLKPLSINNAHLQSHLYTIYMQKKNFTKKNYIGSNVIRKFYMCDCFQIISSFFLNGVTLEKYKKKIELVFNC